MNIMDIFQYRRLNIETTRSKEDILQVIEWNTMPKRPSLLIISRDRPFCGRITEHGFKISQIIDFWSFVPGVPCVLLAIKGRITAESGKTIVTISMRPIVPNVIFNVFFLVFTIFFVLGTLRAPILFKLAMVLLFGIAYRILYYAFKNEADKAQEKLNQMLNS